MKNVSILSILSVFLIVLVTVFPKSSNAQCPSLGEPFGGGIVFYVDGGNPCHGLIAAETDLPDKMAWSVVAPIVVPGLTSHLGDGKTNTDKIIQVLGNTGNDAARMARNYTAHGLNDWYLPSEDELNILYQNDLYVGICTFYTGPGPIHITGVLHKPLPLRNRQDMHKSYNSALFVFLLLPQVHISRSTKNYILRAMCGRLENSDVFRKRTVSLIMLSQGEFVRVP